MDSILNPMAQLDICVEWALCCATCGSEQECDNGNNPGPTRSWKTTFNVVVRCPCLLERVRMGRFTGSRKISFEDFEWQPKVRVLYA